MPDVATGPAAPTATAGSVPPCDTAAMVSDPLPPPPLRGRLASGDEAPATGERSIVLAATGAFTVEQILSGRLEAPADYLQDHDEWVVLLDGAAEVQLGGRAVELRAGDWLLLPAGVPHRLLRTSPGSSWLAVRSRPTPDGGRGGDAAP
jgi:hypothetical protein